MILPGKCSVAVLDAGGDIEVHELFHAGCLILLEQISTAFGPMNDMEMP